MTDVEKIRRELSGWFSRRKAVGIVFHESLNPAHDPNDSYKIIYEAVFEPAAIDQMRIEIWLEKHNCIAVGIETKARVARRLGLRNTVTGFAGGYEPHSLPHEKLLDLLDIVADGGIAISARTLPWLGLVSTKALMHSACLKEKNSVVKDLGPAKWIEVIDDFEERNLLLYKPWMLSTCSA